jgi:predicted acetylornithine/succinylornithine family transaminase
MASNIAELEERYLMHTYKRMPGVFVRGEGCYLWDETGKRYLDFLAGIAVCQLGHCHPAVVKALVDQASTLMHTSNYLVSPSQVKLAEKLCQISGMDKVFYSVDGTTANEAALKIAKKHGLGKCPAGDYEIISLNNSFHGRSLGSLSATAQARYQTSFQPLLPGFRHIPVNDISALRAAFSDKTAAITMEPIQGEGGVMPVTEEFAKEAKRLCEQHNAFFICDEVQAGIGRTGKWFCFQHWGFLPDILCIAKALGGGVPVGACLTHGAASEVFAYGDHGSTFSGSPISTCTGLVVLDVIERENLMENAVAMGKLLADSFKALGSVVAEVRGVGLMVGVKLKEPIARDVVMKALEDGLITNATDDYTLRLIPPLNITKVHVAEAMAIYAKALGVGEPAAV